jgi:hypothetical protein
MGDALGVILANEHAAPLAIQQRAPLLAKAIFDNPALTSSARRTSFEDLF